MTKPVDDDTWERIEAMVGADVRRRERDEHEQRKLEARKSAPVRR